MKTLPELKATCIVIVRLLRPHQWAKNIFCLPGLFFGENGGRLTEPDSILRAALVFLVFCFISSAGYIFNDILDSDKDKRHPEKCNRPLAAGMITVPLAGIISLILFVAGLAVAVRLGPSLLACVVLYAANSFAYSYYLKYIVLVDVISLALGYVMRLLAGIYVLGDVPTVWIMLCTFFLTLFISIAKRRGELLILQDEDSFSRPVLSLYSIDYLDSLLTNSATMTLLSYALFTVISGKNSSLIITILFVYVGIMHYKRLVMAGEAGESPDRLFLRDKTIRTTLLLWTVSYFSIMYWNVNLFR